MFVLLYTLIIGYFTYVYRYDLLYFILDMITYIKEIYINFINSYYKKYGCRINEIDIHDNISFIKYNFSNKSYILYLDNTQIYKYLFFKHFEPNFPYDISLKYLRIEEKTITNDDDIIYAYVTINNEEIDVTDFCKMISGPRGNFYSDLLNVIKPTSKVYHKALIEYIINNSEVDLDKSEIEKEYYKINYMTTFGEEYILE
jgi:hypothetical protein